MTKMQSVIYNEDQDDVDQDYREEHQQPAGECDKFCPWFEKEHWHGHVHWLTAWEMPADLQEKLDGARKEWNRLKEAGTPYWCIHEGRGVDHPAAYWKENGYFREDGLQMQYKHGVMCSECGGYIQEG